MRQRLKHLLLVTLGGVAIGILGDVFLSPEPFSFSNIVGGILFSPLIVTFGGGHVSIEGAKDFFLLGGLLFWPVYIGLAVLWLKLESISSLLLVLPWTAQAFFQIGLRLAVMSGV